MATREDRSETTSRGSSQSVASLTTGVLSVAVGAYVLVMFLGVKLSVLMTPRPEPAVHARLASAAPGSEIPVELARHGRRVFETTCALCHSSSGLGKAGLGKDLVRSDFVADTGDAALVAFIEKGRPATDPQNTMKIPMPPKGGVDSLTQDDLRAVVNYVRALQDPRRMPALEAWAPPAVVITEADKAAALAAAGGDAELAQFIASGNKLFHSTCVACHGSGGVGIQGNGKALVKNEFIKSLNDDALLAFVKQGRAPGDPKNTTGIQMPPKGGNPAMSDDDILDVISYLRTLQGDAPGAAKGK